PSVTVPPPSGPLRRGSIVTSDRSLSLCRFSEPAPARPAMISLALFPPPSTAGGVTLYELNNELVAGPQCEEDTQAFHLQVLGLPPVAIQKDSLKQHSRSDHSTKAAFIHHCESVWKRSGNAWRESGLSGVLCEIAASDDE
ncbi:hypothetical protein scyTo_0025140, partial [Scyliorhinus torazame]|nr:hypothetical protein [Scyliorhinus torazame]